MLLLLFVSTPLGGGCRGQRRAKTLWAKLGVLRPYHYTTTVVVSHRVERQGAVTSPVKNKQTICAVLLRGTTTVLSCTIVAPTAVLIVVLFHTVVLLCCAGHLYVHGWKNKKTSPDAQPSVCDLSWLRSASRRHVYFSVFFVLFVSCPHGAMRHR